MVGRQSTNAGTLAASAWLSALGLNPPPGTLRWHAEISLDVRPGPAPAEFDEARDTRFHVDIYSEEWGFVGSLALVALYAFLVLWCLRVASSAKDRSP